MKAHLLFYQAFLFSKGMCNFQRLVANFKRCREMYRLRQELSDAIRYQRVQRIFRFTKTLLIFQGIRNFKRKLFNIFNAGWIFNSLITFFVFVFANLLLLFFFFFFTFNCKDILRRQVKIGGVKVFRTGRMQRVDVSKRSFCSDNQHVCLCVFCFVYEHHSYITGLT